ncbi:hypothetical protein BRD17_09365 [Halobacteriales archaeon SW_7_68_16]|nr:MAG: hypothetical protein BRD17_09365 [Halobacteriales archaeon SW_7_68_16]
MQFRAKYAVVGLHAALAAGIAIIAALNVSAGNLGSAAFQLLVAGMLVALGVSVGRIVDRRLAEREDDPLEAP